MIAPAKTILVADEPGKPLRLALGDSQGGQEYREISLQFAAQLAEHLIAAIRRRMAGAP